MIHPPPATANFALRKMRRTQLRCTINFEWLSSYCITLYKMSEYFRKYIKKQHYPTPPSAIKFKTSFRNCVYKALVAREWRQIEADDWNVMWCEKEQIDWVFEKRILHQAKVNHFRGWNQLCRKDALSKNLKKYKRGLDKQGNTQESNEYDFLPSTFLMPSQYVIFFEQFKKYQQNEGRTLWIMKPTSKCQGRGIFIFNKISDISKWKSTTKDSYIQNYVCQRYILNPLLFGGRKFDMRIYALCLSYQPLTIYLYRSGFARFAHDRYDNSDLDNLYKHLTNVAINMNAPTYVKRIGGKWFLDNLKNFMLSKLGIEKTNDAFSDIQRCIIKSMKAVQKLVMNSHHSFELYGFDFLFDTNCKAWLLEVNGGPSMTANTPEDSDLKVGLIDDVMTLINVEGILKGDEEVVGGFDLIYKQKDVSLPTPSIYSTMLGCKSNRIESIKKLARNCAIRLNKEYLEKEAAELRIKEKAPVQPNKFNLKKPKSISSNNNLQTNSTPQQNNTRKRIENVKPEFTKYSEDKKPEHQPKHDEEEEEEQE